MGNLLRHLRATGGVADENHATHLTRKTVATSVRRCGEPYLKHEPSTDLNTRGKPNFRCGKPWPGTKHPLHVLSHLLYWVRPCILLFPFLLSRFRVKSESLSRLRFCDNFLAQFLFLLQTASLWNPYGNLAFEICTSSKGNSYFKGESFWTYCAW